MKVFYSIAIFLLLLFPIKGIAHPMPNSVIQMDIYQQTIQCELQLPLSELELATGFGLDKEGTNGLMQARAKIEEYIRHHFQVKDKNAESWKMAILGMHITKAEQTATGMYRELVIKMTLKAPIHADARAFSIYYDVIMHQVITHKALVCIRQDWETGRTGEDNIQIGSIYVDTSTLKVYPFSVQLEKGNSWEGFKSMVILGMKHISEGTDHLMFLLVLLLTALLVPIGRKWGVNSNLDHCFLKILKISIAFTVGHSLTLILATLGVVRFPVKPVEIIIAFSILITAIHAIRPVFANKESFVAAGFGLIHGLAFSAILSELHLTSWRLAVSLLGFNIGIELMQLLVILLVMPWLILISRQSHYYYKLLKNFLAILAGVASIAWMLERILGEANFISTHLSILASHAILFVVFLFLISMCCYTAQYIKRSRR
jgi:hypothetical protein